MIDMPCICCGIYFEGDFAQALALDQRNKPSLVLVLGTEKQKEYMICMFLYLFPALLQSTLEVACLPAWPAFIPRLPLP